jgi:dihydroorotate dehydrogenase
VGKGVAGLVVDGGIRADHEGRLFGPSAQEPTVRLVGALRARRIHGGSLPIIACGGVHEPIEALQLLRAGASLVTLHSGLVYAGPGLPKRVNDALAYEAQQRAGESEATAPRRPAWTGWLWITLLGAALTVGGIAALIVAATRVVLPYDEAFLGLSREQMLVINPRLLDFLAHDRMTFAGIMLSLGVLYSSLAWNGMRRGMRWAATAVRASGLIGFASFFLFVGYGYFDPLHAATSVILFVVFVLGMRGQLPALQLSFPNLRNDRRWRLGLWGQLLVVAIGVGLLLGGLAICGFGVSVVFVPSDLEFMGTTAEALTAANPKLLPLVAHDRAGFGGALVAEGVLVLLTALWGFRERARWLWWTLVVAGVPAFFATVGTHFVVGYVDAFHLAPAYLALGLYVLALVLSYPYLVAARGGEVGRVTGQRQRGPQGTPERSEPLVTG